MAHENSYHVVKPMEKPLIVYWELEMVFNGILMVVKIQWIKLHDFMVKFQGFFIPLPKFMVHEKLMVSLWKWTN